MSIRFAIKNFEPPAKKEGDSFVRFSGVSEPFRRSSDRECNSVGRDTAGNPVLIYNTGLNKDKIDLVPWYNDQEKEEIKKQIDDLAPAIIKKYGGEQVVSETNGFFWGGNRDVSRLSLTNQNMDVFYDTKNVAHALLYLSIISGAFGDLVAPTKDWAERNAGNMVSIPHYMILDTEELFDDDDEITKSDAHAALSELRKDESGEALFILAWCMQYDTASYGAYLKSTPLKSLINYHIQFINGKLNTKNKKNPAKLFIDYYEKWKGQQTRPKLYTEAYIKAGEYYNFIQARDKRYTTTDGTALGNTIPEAVDNIMKPKFTQDYEKLRDQVEKKWKE